MPSIVPVVPADGQQAHLPLWLGSHSGRRVVPKLTLEPLDRQRRRLPRDSQDPAAPAHCLHISGCVRFHCRGETAFMKKTVSLSVTPFPVVL